MSSLPSPCLSVNWKACTKRRTSSTDLPTGKSFIVICRRIPLSSTINNPLFQTKIKIRYSVNDIKLQDKHEHFKFRDIFLQKHLQSPFESYKLHCRYSLSLTRNLATAESKQGLKLRPVRLRMGLAFSPWRLKLSPSHHFGDLNFA